LILHDLVGPTFIIQVQTWPSLHAWSNLNKGFVVNDWFSLLALCRPIVLFQGIVYCRNFYVYINIIYFKDSVIVGPIF